jgi:DNA-binding response OmpR family regulator
MTVVLVAHDSDQIRQATERVLREAGYQTVGAKDGRQARALLFTEQPPQAMVVDVGLSGEPAYQLVADIRHRDLAVKVVLVASVYSKTAYKRRPTSLYGADDYIEQHHIPDELVNKLIRLMPGSAKVLPLRQKGQTVPDPTRETSVVRHIREAGEERITFHFTCAEEDVARARRVARLILADALLYNGSAVEEGLKNGDLEARIRPDLEAVRELFALRVPPEIAKAEDYIGDALREFVGSRSPQG